MAALENARHEKFAQCISSGMSQRKAYRAAFPKSEKWKDNTVDSRASELYKKSEVLGRIRELAEASSDDAIMNARQRKVWLTKIIKGENEDRKDQLKAVDILNRMEGEYIDKVQLGGEVNNPMAGLTTEELRKLVENG